MRFDRIKLYSGNRFLRALEWTTLNISNDTKSFTNFEPFFKKEKFLKMSINWCQDVYRLVLTRPHKLIESFSSVLYSSFSNSYIFFYWEKRQKQRRWGKVASPYNTILDFCLVFNNVLYYHFFLRQIESNEQSRMYTIHNSLCASLKSRDRHGRISFFSLLYLFIC